MKHLFVLKNGINNININSVLISNPITNDNNSNSINNTTLNNTTTNDNNTNSIIPNPTIKYRAIYPDQIYANFPQFYKNEEQILIQIYEDFKNNIKILINND